jgi:hypothetical protein
VQVGELALEQQMHMVVARDVAGAAGPNRAQCLLDRREHRGVLTHTEKVVRASHRHLGADAVVAGTRKAAAAPFEIGKDPVSPFDTQRVEALVKEALVIHAGPAGCHYSAGG